MNNRTEEIEHLNTRIRIFKGAITAILSDIADPIQINKSIDRHFELIQEHQGAIDLLVYRRNNLHNLLDEKQQQLRLMSKELQRLRNSNVASRLETIKHQLAELGITIE